VRQSKQFKKKQRRQANDSIYKIERAARDRADDQARRVPWQRLLEARSQYVKMQQFHFWARSVIETEDGIPDWLARMLDRRCPGFIEDQRPSNSNRPKIVHASLRLLFWIQEPCLARQEMRVGSTLSSFTPSEIPILAGQKRTGPSA
jgi:hypothetical protein